MGEALRVGLPARRAELIVDELAGRRLVQRDLGARRLGACKEGLDIRRCRGGACPDGGELGLQAGIVGGQRGLLRLALLGKGERRGMIFGFSLSLLFRRQSALCFFFCRCAGCFGRRAGGGVLSAETLQLVADRTLFLGPSGIGALFGHGIGWRDKRSGMKLRVGAEGAVEPDRQLAAKAKLKEGLAVVAVEIVGRLIPAPA